MHLLMIVIVLIVVWGLRLNCLEAIEKQDYWQQSWQKVLGLFLFPPLLLLTTSLAVLWMGPQGQMVGLGAGWLSYGLAISFLGFAGILWLKLAWDGSKTLQKTRTYPLINIGNKQTRLVDIPDLFSAQIGFWQPELVVSQGMLNTLNDEQLQAVLAHEQAHYYYRDTFLFFWLGWMHRLTIWLPYTEALWEELLILREIRADRWAAKIVDPLLLAESLLLVVSHPVIPLTNFAAAFSAVAQRNRLSTRIEALLMDSNSSQKNRNCWSYPWLILCFLPLATIPFHR